MVVYLIQKERKVMAFGDTARTLQGYDHSLDCFLCGLLTMVAYNLYGLG